ncbi:glycosyltransferase family 9 protein [Psychroflexus halocasei]|uniref:Heptosyltransferase-2 n=1 Tax=Psychroflexus halocasei TaxID=908615 RepID=A0A1H3X5Y4_9FLAO|nr:glycosyltransferase family 9 protein [Psychroflexus halocasei]MDN6311130.1 glycosyltransferase family 9 protein [Psychroflexus sp.]SDZ94331.1 heptosyltransferase-2 [Psychroflexus halocasei]
MKILVIQQKMIGDVLISSLICENLKKNFPESEVHYLVNAFCKPVVQGNPYIDKFILFEDQFRKSKTELFKFLGSIKREKYTHVFDAYGKIESNLVSLFSKASFKASYYKPYTSWIYQKTFKELSVNHSEAGTAIDNRIKLLKTLKDVKVYNNKPKIYLTKEEKNSASEVFKKHGLSGHKTIMISSMGSNNSKTYPIEYMAEVLDFITSQTDFDLIFNYLPQQKKEVQTLYDLCSKKTQQKINLELTAESLRGFMTLCDQCKAIIGNEGGTINMAKALDVPSFAIFSPWILKDGWNSFEKNHPNASVHLNDYKPELCKEPTKILKEKSSELYQAFKPELFLPKLERFINQYVN